MDLTLFEKYHSEVLEIAKANTRIATHAIMEMAFLEAVQINPSLAVELGVGVNGLRTKAICRACALCNATLLGCDIRDCRGCGNDWYENWHFFQADARKFHKRFKNICDQLFISPVIDLLFIDTTERYKTTSQIVHSWFPFLGKNATVMFRCSNLQKELIYSDGSSTMLGWDNKRGVIRVIEKVINGKFDETKEFEGNINGWEIKHVPWGAGLTVMKRTENDELLPSM